MKLEYLPPDAAKDEQGPPLIRLYDFDTADACRLQDVLRSLRAGTTQSVALDELPRIESLAGTKLRLVRGARDRGLRQEEAGRFVWYLSADG